MVASGSWPVPSGPLWQTEPIGTLGGKGERMSGRTTRGEPARTFPLRASTAAGGAAVAKTLRGRAVSLAKSVAAMLQQPSLAWAGDLANDSKGYAIAHADADAAF
jgi:hypothetical protein